MEILRALAAEAGGAAGRIEVITTASSEPEQVWAAYERAFREIGVGYAAPMHIRTRAEAEAPELLERIADSTAVFFHRGGPTPHHLDSGRDTGSGGSPPSFLH